MKRFQSTASPAWFVLEKDTEVQLRSKKDIKHLAQIKDVVSSLNPLIAGAIGENLVVKEIEKLSDDYILINDFSLKFAEPIYNRKEKGAIRNKFRCCQTRES